MHVFVYTPKDPSSMVSWDIGGEAFYKVKPEEKNKELLKKYHTWETNKL